MYGIVLTNGETLIHSDELCHHGVKGQKWGVRRFQDKNGALTRAEKARLKESGDRAGIKQLKKAKDGARRVIAGASGLAMKRLTRNLGIGGLLSTAAGVGTGIVVNESLRKSNNEYNKKKRR